MHPRNQVNPDVAYNKDSNQYFVVWEDYRNSEQWDIWGQRLTAGGDLLGPDVAICTDGANQYGPSVSYAAASRTYLVVWTDYRNGADDQDVYGGRVSAAGELVSSDVAIAAAAMGQGQPDVAYHETAAEYLVAWTDNRSGQNRIMAQRRSAAAVPSSSEFLLSPVASIQSQGDVVCLPGGRAWFVSWEDQRSGPRDIYARFYEPPSAAAAGS